MPLYEYRCTTCRAKHSQYRPIAESKAGSLCPECGSAATRVLSATHLATDYEPYKCPITDKWIEGRKQHEENLKLHGCRVFEAGERQRWLEDKAKRDAMFENDIEQTVGETISSWPAEKQQKLAQELEHGASAEAVRA
jgi:putative FmdB family regulatory protein